VLMMLHGDLSAIHQQLHEGRATGIARDHWSLSLPHFAAIYPRLRYVEERMHIWSRHLDHLRIFLDAPVEDYAGYTQWIEDARRMVWFTSESEEDVEDEETMQVSRRVCLPDLGGLRGMGNEDESEGTYEGQLNPNAFGGTPLLRPGRSSGFAGPPRAQTQTLEHQALSGYPPGRHVLHASEPPPVFGLPTSRPLTHVSIFQGNAQSNPPDITQNFVSQIPCDGGTQGPEQPQTTQAELEDIGRKRHTERIQEITRELRTDDEAGRSMPLHQRNRLELELRSRKMALQALGVTLEEDSSTTPSPSNTRGENQRERRTHRPRSGRRSRHQVPSHESDRDPERESAFLRRTKARIDHYESLLDSNIDSQTRELFQDDLDYHHEVVNQLYHAGWFRDEQEDGVEGSGHSLSGASSASASASPAQNIPISQLPSPPTSPQSPQPYTPNSPYSPYSDSDSDLDSYEEMEFFPNNDPLAIPPGGLRVPSPTRGLRFELMDPREAHARFGAGPEGWEPPA
jgi:hypothetical protein